MIQSKSGDKLYFMFKNIVRISLFIISFLFCNTANSQKLYDIEIIRDFKIHFYDINWKSRLNDYKVINSDQRVLAGLTVNNKVYDSVGVKFKGNSSFNSAFLKNPINIKIDYKIKKQKLMGYKTIKLSNLFMDPSGIREVLAYKIISKYLPCSKANFVQVFINDSLIGLYTNTEVINKSFVRKNFQYHKGAFFKCENTSMELKPKGCKVAVADGLTIGFTLDSVCYSNKYELLSKYGWNELLKLMMNIWYNSDNKSKYYHKIENILDIDKVMWMLAFNNLFVNLDSYNWSGRNYYLVQDSNKVFHPIMWDMNMSFGGFSHFYNPAKLAEFPVFSCEDNIYRPLISKLFLIPEYKQMYINHYIELLKNEVLNGNLKSEALKLHQQISGFIKADPYFYYDYKTFENSLYKSYKNEIPGILELMDKRVEYLKTVKELNAAFEIN